MVVGVGNLRDRALIMLNAISGFMLLVTILREW